MGWAPEERSGEARPLSLVAKLLRNSCDGQRAVQGGSVPVASLSILIVQESCPTAPLSWRRRSIHVSIERRGAPRSNRTQSLAGGPRLALGREWRVQNQKGARRSIKCGSRFPLMPLCDLASAQTFILFSTELERTFTFFSSQVNIVKGRHARACASGPSGARNKRAVVTVSGHIYMTVRPIWLYAAAWNGRLSWKVAFPQ